MIQKAKVTAQFLFIKTRLSARTIAWVHTRWRYAVLAVLAAFGFFQLMYWLLNLGLFQMLMLSSALTAADKLKLMLDPFRTVIETGGVAFGVVLFALSVAQGLTIATLVFTIRHQKKVDVAAVGGGSVAGLLAAIGLGCPACGTSLVSPIVALFVSGGSASISEKITAVSMPIALLVGVYALYTVGLKAARSRAELDLAANMSAKSADAQ